MLFGGLVGGARMRTVLWVGVLALCGCVAGDEPGDGVDDSFATGKADGSIEDGSPEACAALGAANQASLDQLDDDAGLASNAARSLIEHRPFADLAALDAAPWIGPSALEHLVAYGAELGVPCDAGALAGLRLHGSLFLYAGTRQDEYSAGLAGYTATLRAGTAVRVHAIGPGTRSNAIVDVYGPIASEATLARAPHLAGPGAPDVAVEVVAPADGVYVVTVREADGRRGFFGLNFGIAADVQPGEDLVPLDPAIGCDDDGDCPAASACGANRGMVSVDAPATVCNPTLPGRWEHGACDEAGGTYRTITVTADQACAMVDFLNHAPFSAMATVGVFRQWTYESSRAGTWRTLAQWARTNFEHLSVTSGAVTGLKLAAARLPAHDGVVEDTVASTFRDRSRLSGKGVFLPTVRATALAADGPDGEHCLEIRDAADAPDFLLACSCGNNPACDPRSVPRHPPAGGLVGLEITVGGTLRFTAGRWRIDALTLLPRDP